MVEVTHAALPKGEWRVLTCFDTLIYYDIDRAKLCHGEVYSSPRNVTVAQTPEGASVRIEGRSASGTIPPDSKRGDQPIIVQNAGWENNVAFSRRHRFMTAHPDGSVSFESQRLMAWEMLRLIDERQLDSGRYWRPDAKQGGTELMVQQLLNVLGEDGTRINLRLNGIGRADEDAPPLVVWIHNEPTQPVYDWCRDPKHVAKVARFVFVSQWQRQRFMEMYRLPPERCVVIRNAIVANETTRAWPAHSKWRWRCAYISAPFRGLDILLDAWQDLSPINAELHIWSGQSLWLVDDHECRSLFARTNEIPNVVYHRIAPNETIRAALLDMHFLLYPCTYDETFCISMVEAMASGCRVIASSRAALPETGAGFARLYPFVADRTKHKRVFLEALADELANPWGGELHLAEAQQAYCRVAFDWAARARQWRDLIGQLTASGTKTIESPA